MLFGIFTDDEMKIKSMRKFSNLFDITLPEILNA